MKQNVEKIVEKTLNLLAQKIPTNFSIQAHEQQKHLGFVNVHTGEQYDILLTDKNDYSLETYAKVISLQDKGHVVCVLPIKKDYHEEKVTDDPRYFRRNYQNIKEDFGTINFNNFYFHIAPIRTELAFPMQNNLQLGEHINEQGQLEIYTIQQGEDRDGPREDIQNVQNILETEIKDNKWIFYTPRQGDILRALLGPIENEYLQKRFIAHNT